MSLKIMKFDGVQLSGLSKKLFRERAGWEATASKEKEKKA